ncbi:VOC family protein [bacterium]|nr:VOC family protein [bacterium]
MRLNHAELFVSDVPRSLRFYEEVLNAAVIEEHETRAVLQLDLETTLTLRHMPPDMYSPFSDGIRLYFECTHFEDDCRRLRRAGLEFSARPRATEEGRQEALIQDPDGHEVCLYRSGVPVEEESLFSFG